VLTFGGQVMKNVAGYDVSRLLAGSLGSLGLILEYSIKVLPRPVREASLRFEVSEIEAIGRLNEWAAQPLPISASCWHDGVLTLRLSGASAAVGEAARALGGQAVPDADTFWTGVRDQQHAFFAGAASLWRLSVPPCAGAIILGGEQLIEWGGAQRWLKVEADAQAARKMRAAVGALGGHATLFRGGDKSVGVFHPLAPGVARIHQRLKNAFDPTHVFNPGRLF
jgi:glycolate oxidase FAD binding subunit